MAAQTKTLIVKSYCGFISCTTLFQLQYQQLLIMDCVKICSVFSVFILVAAVAEDASVSGKITYYRHHHCSCLFTPCSILHNMIFDSRLLQSQSLPKWRIMLKHGCWHSLQLPLWLYWSKVPKRQVL